MRGWRDAGRLLMALAVAGFGAVVIVFGDLGLIWESPAVAHRAVLAEVGGGLLLVVGLALLLPARAAAVAGLALLGLLLAKVTILCIPALVRGPAVPLNWYAPGEALAWAAGAMVFAASRGGRLTRLARYVLGVALIPIGLSHFFYLKTTAALVPPWLPLGPDWAMATGACHLAAGLALLVGIVPRLAVRLEAAMMGLFTLLVWVPAVATKPSIADDWSELCISAALTAAAWAVAANLSARPANARR